jgi:translocation and assembly module TamB
MSWKTKAGCVVFGLAMLLLVAAVVGYSYLKSTSFKNYALRKIAEQVDRTTGGKSAIGGMEFSLSPLRASLYDITLHGSEGTEKLPLLRVDKLTVQLKILSLLHRHVALREIVIEHPVVRYKVNHDGKSNLPQAPPSPTSSHTSVFDLAVEHAQVNHGEVNYNDRRIPMEADLRDLATDIRFDSLARRYDGVLSYRDGSVRYAEYAALPHNLDLKFSATPDAFSVESAILRVGTSDVALRAKLSDYGNPVANANYRIHLHTQDLAQMFPAARTAGDVTLDGTLHYHSLGNQALLRSVAIDGRIGSDAVVGAVSGRRFDVRRLAADYRIGGGNLQIRNLVAESLGGRITAAAEMMHLDSQPESNVRVSLRDVSIRALQQNFNPQDLQGAKLSGTLDGNFEASWKGAIRNLRARSDLTLQGRASNRSSPSAIDVPVDGAIHLTYDGRRQTLELKDTTITMPSTTLAAQGTISDHSALQVKLNVSDLNRLVQVASSLASSQRAVPAVSGQARLDALIQGSLSKPKIAAKLNGQNLRIEDSEWSSASLDLHADPSQLTVDSGSLTNARGGQVSFRGSVALQNWSYLPANRIQARLNAQRMRIAELEELAALHLPISGEASATLALDGSEMDPAGSGQVEIVGASVYGEPLDKVEAKLHAENGSLASAMVVSARPGTINLDLSFTPRTKAYRVRINVPSLTLQKLHSLQSRSRNLSGTLSASVTGEGTLDNPQLTANVQLPHLQIRDRSIDGAKAEASISEHRLNLKLDSNVSQTALTAAAQVNLNGDYEAEGEIDTGIIPLDTVIASYEPNVPEGFQGQAELHAKIKGPLKDKTRVEAHLSIPVLKASYQSLEIGITNPIRADYGNSVLTIQPAELQGTGTSLRLQGKVPIGGTTPPTFSAQGSVDVRILKIMAPDVDSSGTVALDVHASGSGTQPVIQGQLQLKDISLTTPTAPVGIDKLNGALDISNDRVQVSTLSGRMGGGNISMSGSIAYRPNLQFNLALQSQSVRLLYPPGMRSMLDANLTFNGTPSASTLNGRLLIDSLSFTPSFDLSSFADQFSTGSTISQPGFADTIKLALSVQSQQSLSATSSQISIAGQAALQVGGTAANPVITGRTTLTSGDLFYRDVRYELQRGVITFDNPNQTRPVLNISVKTTIEQYNLTLTLRGPLDALTTSYASDPPLATADIINLVARGKTTQEQAAASQSTDSMIASELAGQLSSSVQKLAGISSFSLDPTLGGNNQNPSARVAIQQRVSKNFLFTFSTDVTQPGSEIILGEYRISKRWSVSAARDETGGVSVDGRYHKSW